MSSATATAKSAAVVQRRLDSLRAELEGLEEAVGAHEASLGRAKADGAGPAAEASIRDELARLEADRRATVAAIEICAADLDAAEAAEEADRRQELLSQIDEAAAAYRAALVEEHAALIRAAKAIVEPHRRRVQAFEHAVKLRAAAKRAGCGIIDEKEVLHNADMPSFVLDQDYGFAVAIKALVGLAQYAEHLPKEAGDGA